MIISVNTLKKILRENLLDFGVSEFVKSVYLFGSAVYDSNPRDIDLLFVYDTCRNHEINLIIKFRSIIKDKIKANTNKEVDIILLDLEEYSETDYVLLSKIMLYP